MKTPVKRFANCRWKIKRANKHIAEMNTLLSECHKPDFYTVQATREPKTGQNFIEYGFAKRIPVEDLALIIGDAVHNLKCALDYAWIHVIRKVAPKALRNFAKFPIYPSRSELESALRGHGIQLASPTLYDLIVSDIKPYDGGDHLWSIHRTDIEDKHRLLIPVLDVAVVELTLEDDEGKLSKYLCAFTGGGAYRKPIEGNQKLKHKSSVRLQVVFQEGLPAHGMEVSAALDKLAKVALGVVETLERFVETA